MTTTANPGSPGTTPTDAAAGSTPSGRASGSRMGAGAPLPRAGGGGGSGVAPLRGNTALLQTVLFWAGAVLMPTGIVVILLGYVGVANAPQVYDREAYSYSGGFLGLALTFLGGFLYFGAWLAKIASDNNTASKRLADTLLVLADVTSRAAGVGEASSDLASVPVTSGANTTLHRRDCALIAHREDLQPAGTRTGLTECRVCRPI